MNAKIALNENLALTPNLNSTQAKKKRLNMSERAQEQMTLLFGDVINHPYIWTRKKNHGYSTIPRTLPIAMQAIDEQSKGQPAGHTLFCLWARSPDHPLVAIENQAIFAAEAGYSGERAVDTWRRRMKKLVELGFILPKSGTSGDFHYILLINPNAAIESLWINKKIREQLYVRFKERLGEIGALQDIEEMRAFLESQNKGGTNG